VAEKKRLANIELMRVLAMVMIVIMHFLRESGSLLGADVSATEQLSAQKLLGTFLEAFCIVAVNGYVFISGYFGSEGSFRLSKVVSFLCRVWFYALLIPAVLAIFGVETIAKEQGIYGILRYVLPIESETYWFATAYFFLMLLMPVCNAAVKHLGKKELQALLGCLLVMFCLLKSISPAALTIDRYGYDFSWFCCVYLLAAYLKKYGCPFLEKRGFTVYAGSCLVIFLMTVVLWYLARDSYYFTVPFHYNFVLCLTGALGLFYGFMKISIPEGKGADLIRKAGAYSFGIYLFHEHPDIRYRWFPLLKSILNPEGKEGIGIFTGELVCSVVILFAIGLFLEWLRNLLFTLVKRMGRRSYAERKQ
jgi:surface polysaccharide O-acyltransferase-like enzyme